MLLSVLLEQDRQAGNTEYFIFLGLAGVSFISWTGDPDRQSVAASLDDHLLDAQSQTFLLQQGEHSADKTEDGEVR